MDRERKKELITSYKQQKAVAGLHLIENLSTGRALLLPTPNVAGAESRFAFGRGTGMSPHPAIKDWRDGVDFRITLLDTLEIEDDWDRRRIKEELQTLSELWREKLGERDWY